MPYKFVEKNIGRKIGRLTIIEAAPPKIRKSGRDVGQLLRYYYCKCDCGKIKSIRLDALNGKKTRSCGCLQKEIASAIGKRFKLPLGEKPRNDLFSNYKYRAKQENYVFNISLEQFTFLIGQNCYYCGQKPSQIAKNRKIIYDFLLYNGIDRLNPQIGYVIENCVTCCGGCNYAKLDSTKEEFVNRIIQIYNYLNLKDYEDSERRKNNSSNPNI